ncbi:MAG: T9SS type A sorting domain-containing protein [Muribaculaceae bacterium]|nr:T9SS type A sorting domain-containing protein [Muribaculaceae bacterium]
MKKTITLLAASSCIAIYAFADFRIDFSKIRHWSGKGDREAALVVQFLDDYERKAYVWGFRWQEGEEPTGEEMIRKIAAESTDICALVQLTGVYGSTLDGIGYSARNSILDHISYDFEGAADDPYIMFDFFSPNLMMGQHTAPGDEAQQMCNDAIAKAKTTNIIEHPLNYTEFGYPAYDYDWWQADETSSEMRWNAGWYSGYWSYWLGNKGMDSSEYSYSGLGMTSVKLKDGDVNAWKFMPLDGPVNPDDFIDGTSGATIPWAEVVDYDHFEASSSEAIFIEDHAPEEVEIYDIQGRYVGKYHAGERYDLPSGIYVAKRGTKAVKFFKK